MSEVLWMVGILMWRDIVMMFMHGSEGLGGGDGEVLGGGGGGDGGGGDE